MQPLHTRTFEPCRADTPPLQPREIHGLLRHLPNWRVVDGHHLERVYDFPDFGAAMAFCVQVGALAEAHNHHPDLAFGWGWAEVKLWTHAIDGLAEGDFILAAKIEQLDA